MSSLTVEYLQKPLPIWNPKAWYYGGVSAVMRTLGKCSNGISIGYTYGFDSGVMLEYVYKNNAAGKFVIGPVMDRIYLNAPGWKGIRNRGELVKNTIKDAIAEQYTKTGKDVRVIDLACGGGRYVLEALAELPKEVKFSALLRDYKRENVETAKALAKQLGVEAKIEQGDAFSDFDLEGLYNSADIVIVSGLHEIIEENHLVENHFNQVFKIMKKGGIFINTVQPNHPQLEFIARVLPSHTGNLWAMRLRSVEQTQSWIKRAGFTLDKFAMEPQNIFGVVTARK